MNILINTVGILLTFFSGFYNQPIEAVGSSFLFKYDQNLYFVSCRHVVEKNIGYEFGIKVNLKEKQNGFSKRTIILDRKNLIFNQNDTKQKTYDIAVFKVTSPKKMEEKLKLNYFMLPEYSSIPKLDINDSLYAIGFPSSELNPKEIENDSIQLTPTILRGKFLYTTPQFNVKLDNFNKSLDGQFYVEVESLPSSGGMSGGLVILKRNNSYIPIGILTSSGNGSYNGKNINFFGFTHLSRIMETINAL